MLAKILEFKRRTPSNFSLAHTKEEEVRGDLKLLLLILIIGGTERKQQKSCKPTINFPNNNVKV